MLAASYRRFQYFASVPVKYDNAVAYNVYLANGKSMLSAVNEGWTFFNYPIPDTDQ
jgi:hypothetical protein